MLLQILLVMGGDYFSPQKALKAASSHLENGAHVIDIGAQSTRPGALEIGPDEELKRLIPALREIRSAHKQAFISVDTYWRTVAEYALREGADWINDVSGGRKDPSILRLVGDAKCPYILTHSRGDSQSMVNLANYDDVVLDVINELLNQTEIATQFGIETDRIVWDPGLGFAKNTEHNLAILDAIDTFLSEGFPLLIGPSRKRFIGDILHERDPLKRVFGTAAVVCRCVQAKVSMVRVHDVSSISDTLLMAKRLWPDD